MDVAIIFKMSGAPPPGLYHWRPEAAADTFQPCVLNDGKPPLPKITIGDNLIDHKWDSCRDS